MLDIKTTTKELAIKISLIVFIFFLFSFLSLIFLHHYKFLYSEKQVLKKFSSIINIDPNFLIKALEIRCRGGKDCIELRTITKDFLVVKANQIILTRGVYDFMDLDKFLDKKFKDSTVYKIETDDKKFYVIKVGYEGYDLFFTRDISFHSDYEESLLLIFLILSIFFTVFIYLLSYKLAKISLEPLKGYNESLKLYNHHIAHELKTPLSVLKSDLELLKIGYDKNILKSSLEEVDNMKNVIDSMLFLSENVILGEKEEIDIVELIDELILIYSKKTDKKIIKNAKNKKVVLVTGDRNLLKTMFKNMIENAIKYSNGKNINIEIFKNSIDMSNTFAYEFNEQDTNKLFEAFYKLNFDPNSFGLGLSIVKKVAELHGFKVFLDIKEKIFKIKISL